MTNKKIYEIADSLRMIEEDIECSSAETDEHYETASDKFEKKTSKDLISVINFVDDLCLCNDLETIKKLLVAIIMENK